MFSWILDQFEPLESKVKKLEKYYENKRHMEKLRLAAIKESHQLIIEQHDKEAQEYQDIVLDRFNELNGEAKIHAKPLTAWPFITGKTELDHPDWEKRDPTRTPLVYETAEYLSSEGFKNWKKKKAEAVKQELEERKLENEKLLAKIEERRKNRGKKSKPWWKIW